MAVDAQSDLDTAPNVVGSLTDPINLTILDTPAFIAENRVGRVTSTMLYEPSTHMFHPEGLFSEVIFGKVGSPERSEKFGYIELNTDILHPKIFKLVGQLGKLYHDIMAGRVYATFDTIEKNFVKSTSDEDDADTGFSFFMDHFREIEFSRTDSDLRDERIITIKKYQSRLTLQKHLVEPAGLRDVKNDVSGRLVQDEINAMYTAIMMTARSIPKGSTSVLYDPVRYQLQAKALELFDYLQNFIDGKYGYIQGAFVRRKLAYGTRNVISAADMVSTTPDGPQMLKSDEVMAGVYQNIKAFFPVCVFYFNSVFIKPIFGTERALNVPLIDPDTKEIAFVEIDEDTREEWCSREGIEDIVNRFENPKIRKDPITVKGKDGKDYYLLMVYDQGEDIGMYRSLSDLKEHWPYPVEPERCRPMTWLEMFYIVADLATKNRYSEVTRFPATTEANIYPAVPHVKATVVSRVVNLVDMVHPDHPPIQFAEYPVLTQPCYDIMAVHPTRLSPLDGDHDGDKLSYDGVWGKDSNMAPRKYLESPYSVMNSNMEFLTGGSTYLSNLMLHNLTY